MLQGFSFLLGEAESTVVLIYEVSLRVRRDNMHYSVLKLKVC